MRHRQWVREGDLIIVWPWDFQDSKADVHRYTKTQSMYLSRKGVLPAEVDVFGMNTQADDFDDEDGLFASSEEEIPVEEEVEEMDDDDDDEINDLFG